MSFDTPLAPVEIVQRMRDANRAGRMPEILNPSDSRFALALASRPLTSRLHVTLSPTPAGATRVDFSVAADLRLLWGLIAFNLLTLWPATWLTDHYFPDIHAWWWVPPLTILMCAWMYLRWPGASRADGLTLAPDMIEAIRRRIDR